MINGIAGGSAATHRPDHQRLFKKLDKNGDGGLDAGELSGMAKRMKKDPAQMLTELDTDQNGSVSAEEMRAGAAKHRRDGPPPEGGPDKGGPAAQAGGKDQDGASGEVTTKLMNILKQLQSPAGPPQAIDPLLEPEQEKAAA
jgi:hypothetical protein